MDDLDFSALKKLAKTSVDSGSVLKVAVLGEHATQFLVKALKGWMVCFGAAVQVHEGEFDLIDSELLFDDSELNTWNPDVVIISLSSRKLLAQYNKADNGLAYCRNQEERVKELVGAVEKRGYKAIVDLYEEINDGVFGNYGALVENSFISVVRNLNQLIVKLAQSSGLIFVSDTNLIMKPLGSSGFDSRTYIAADMIYSVEAVPLLTKNWAQIVMALTGGFKKCLILDLDNTLWGGVIGDDGLESIELGGLGNGKAFSDLQQWAKQLKKRGVILAICSKNNEEFAQEPFIKHPDMVLRLDDISIFVANWQNKADNIRHIQRVLNVGFDSMVFVDDNPFERNQVREEIPEVTVPELPEDPVDYMPYLRSLNLFETVSYSENDAARTKQYQEEAKRVELKSTTSNLQDYLERLEMRSEVKSFSKLSIPRVAQLTQRSNQFNLRTKRYTESEIKQIAENDSYLTRSFGLADKFGDNGLICLGIMKLEDDTAFLDTLIMSCRVLKRGMEQFVMNQLVEALLEMNVSVLKGEYIATAKNGMVKELLPSLGFEPVAGQWVLKLKDYEPFSTKIMKI